MVFQLWNFHSMKKKKPKKPQPTNPNPRKKSQIRNCAIVVTAKSYIKSSIEIVSKISVWQYLIWLSVSNLTILRTDYGSCLWTQWTHRIPLGVNRGIEIADPSVKYIHPTPGKQPLSTRGKKTHQCPPLSFWRESLTPTHTEVPPG